MGGGGAKTHLGRGYHAVRVRGGVGGGELCCSPKSAWGLQVASGEKSE